MSRTTSMGGSMTPARTWISLTTGALLLSAFACGRGAGTAQSEAPPAAPDARSAQEQGSAPGAPPAESKKAPAEALAPMSALQVPAAAPAKAAAEAEKRIETARAASQSASDPLEAKARLAAELYDAGKGPEAERIYREILRDHRDHVGAHVGLAQILIDRDDLAGAGAANASALAANPQSVPALQQKVALLIAGDHASDAVGVAEKALRLDPGSASLQS